MSVAPTCPITKMTTVLARPEPALAPPQAAGQRHENVQANTDGTRNAETIRTKIGRRCRFVRFVLDMATMSARSWAPTACSTTATISKMAR